MTVVLHIGFTGTQAGMTAWQKSKVWELIRPLDFWAHHGDCIGADAEFDSLARQADGCRGVVLHPCDIETKRAHCESRNGLTEVRVIKPPLTRNGDIVMQSNRMIATPKETRMQTRSGTWSTIRKSQDVGRPLAIVFPHGAVAWDGASWS